MPVGVVLDTSFFITLAGPSRANHKNARKYWKHFTEQGIPIYLPTIVVSEFYIQQEIPPDMLRNCVILPFNWDDAVTAAKLDFSKVKRDETSRIELKDDVKIIAQAIVKDAAWIVTDDGKSLYKFANRLKEIGASSVFPIKLEDDFDPSHFHPQQQREITFRDDQSAVED